MTRRRRVRERKRANRWRREDRLWDRIFLRDSARTARMEASLRSQEGTDWREVKRAFGLASVETLTNLETLFTPPDHP